MSEPYSNGDAVDAASKVIDDSVDAASEVSQTLQSSAQNVSDAVTRNASAVADKVNTKIKGVVADAEPLVAAAREKTNDFRTALVDEIKSRPLQSLMAAALAGLVVGVLTSR